jgi:hypothetical protein
MEEERPSTSGSQKGALEEEEPPKKEKKKPDISDKGQPMFQNNVHNAHRPIQARPSPSESSFANRGILDYGRLLQDEGVSPTLPPSLHKDAPGIAHKRL